jgi:hypothetical protein
VSDVGGVEKSLVLEDRGTDRVGLVIPIVHPAAKRGPSSRRYLSWIAPLSSSPQATHATISMPTHLYKGLMEFWKVGVLVVIFTTLSNSSVTWAAKAQPTSPPSMARRIILLWTYEAVGKEGRGRAQELRIQHWR